MDSSLQVLNIRAGSMILRFLGCSGRGLSLVAGVFKHKTVLKMAPRDYFVAMLYLDDSMAYQ